MKQINILKKLKNEDINPWDIEYIHVYGDAEYSEGQILSEEENEYFMEHGLKDEDILKVYKLNDEEESCELPESVKNAVEEGLNDYPIWGLCTDWLTESVVDNYYDEIVIDWINNQSKEKGILKDDSLLKIYIYGKTIEKENK